MTGEVMYILSIEKGIKIQIGQSTMQNTFNYGIGDFEFIVGTQLANHPMTTPDYEDWYHMITRRYISPVERIDEKGIRTGDAALLRHVREQIEPLKAEISNRVGAENEEINLLLAQQLSIYEKIERTLHSQLPSQQQMPYIQPVHVQETQAQRAAAQRRRRNHHPIYIEVSTEPPTPLASNYASSSHAEHEVDADQEEVYRPQMFTPRNSPFTPNDPAQVMPSQFSNVDFDVGSSSQYFGQHDPRINLGSTPIPFHFTNMTQYRDQHQSTSSSNQQNIPSGDTSVQDETEEDVVPEWLLRPPSVRGPRRGRGRGGAHQQANPNEGVQEQRGRGRRNRRAPDCGT